MSIKRLQPFVSKIAALICYQIVVSPVNLLAQTATIHVRLLDGRTGASLSGMDLMFVDYHTDDSGMHHDDLNGRKIVTTSTEGNSYVAEPDAHGVLVFDGQGLKGFWTPCTRQALYDSKTKTYGNENLYPVATIVASGLVARNNCSNLRATAMPGELVIFIRPVTWWEKFVGGMRS